MDCGLPGSSVHGISQARTLDWVAIPFSRGSSWPRDPTRVSCIAGYFIYQLSHQRSPTAWRGLFIKTSTQALLGRAGQLIQSANPHPPGAHSCRKWVLLCLPGARNRCGPEGQDEHEAAALVSFLVFFSGPRVGENFKIFSWREEPRSQGEEGWWVEIGAQGPGCSGTSGRPAGRRPHRVKPRVTDLPRSSCLLVQVLLWGDQEESWGCSALRVSCRVPVCWALPRRAPALGGICSCESRALGGPCEQAPSLQLAKSFLGYRLKSAEDRG